MNRFVKIGKAAEILGVCVQTLRRWEKSGQLVPDKKTEGGTRYYDKDRLIGLKKPDTALTIGYARDSSHDRKKDLVTHKAILENFCTANGWTYEIIDDLGSGTDYGKKGLRRLPGMIPDYKIARLVLTHKDRLLRFGAELVFALCELRQVEVVIINKSENTSSEEELASDVLEIITVSGARLYGSRSHKNRKIKECLAEILNGNSAES